MVKIEQDEHTAQLRKINDGWTELKRLCKEKLGEEYEIYYDATPYSGGSFLARIAMKKTWLGMKKERI